MLVLSRRIGEKIVIPDLDIVLTVLGVRGETVRLGIDAPRNVPVYRREIWVKCPPMTVALEEHA